MVEGQFEGSPDDRVLILLNWQVGPASAALVKQASSLVSMPASAARRPATQSAAILPFPARRSRICAAPVTNGSVALRPLAESLDRRASFDAATDGDAQSSSPPGGGKTHAEPNGASEQ